MNQTLQIEVNGLFTDPSTLSKTPKGALTQADNVVLQRPGVLESRRGQAQYGTALGTAPDKIFNYQYSLLAHAGTTMYYDSNGAGAWTAYTGSYTQPNSANKIHSLEANKSFYFNTSAGVYKIQGLNYNPVLAGAPAGLDGYATITGATGFMDVNVSVAYRVVWGYTDANGYLVLGAPSGRIIASNTSATNTCNVVLNFTIPAGITTAWTYYVYRSDESATPYSSTPDDECALVYQSSPLSSDLTNGYVQFTDITPNSLRGTLLYTNPSQGEGILSAYYQPPFCLDMDYYQNTAFYANCVLPQTLNLSLLAVGGSTGLAVGTVINFTTPAGNFAITGANTANPSAGQFQIYTGGTPAQNIQNTANSIVQVVNRYSGNQGIYASYSSNANQVPGLITLTARAQNTVAFSVQCSTAGAAWIPQLGSAVSSNATTQINAVYYSQSGLPEAVPVVNYLFVGSASLPIKRMVALRDCLFFFKDDGIYQLTGTDPQTFSVALFDGTFNLQGPETAIRFNNQVYCFSTQGVVGVSDTGAAIVSTPVEQDLFTLAALPNFTANTFAIASESDRHYMLFTVTNYYDTCATQAYVYNGLNNAWTHWIMNRSCGVVNRNDNKIYMGNPTNNLIYQERKSFTDVDFADEQYTVNVVGYTGYNITLTSAASVQVGYSLSQSGYTSVITAVNGNVITVSNTGFWLPGAALVYVPITTTVTFVPLTCDNAGMVKQFTNVQLFFRDAGFSYTTLNLTTDWNPSPTSIQLTTPNVGAWGNFVWGAVPWGGGANQQQVLRTWVPQNSARGHWLQIQVGTTQCLTSFGLEGVSVFFNQASERSR